MRTRRSWSAVGMSVVAALWLSGGPAVAAPPAPVDDQPALPGETATASFLVGVDGELSELTAGIEAAGLEAAVQPIDDGLVVVTVDSGSADDVTPLLEGLDIVDSVEEDRPVEAYEVPAPNDALFSSQWGLQPPATAEGVNALAAWQTTLGAPAVVVAVIDSGLIKHPDLKRVLPGWDFVGDDSNVIEDDGLCGGAAPTMHGTHVAGTVAAASNNKIGVAGVAPGVSILPVRVLNHCGSGASSDVAAAILWAAGFEVANTPPNPNPAKVINMSLGSQGTCMAAYQESIDRVVAAGVVVVAAAGNSASTVGSPANCNGVVAVTAGDRNGAKASFSNTGTEADVMAPGVGIQSTYRDVLKTDLVPKKFGAGYSSLSGTSMASPHVAGIAALAASVAPASSPAVIETAIKSSARAFLTTCSGCGAGYADAAGTLAAIGTTTPGVLTPRAQDRWIMSSKATVALAGSTKKWSVELVQGSTTVKVGAVAASARATVTVPAASKGFSAGAATVRFTPADLSSAAIEVPVVLSDAVIEIAGPYSSLATGLAAKVSWKAIGRTTDTVDLFLENAQGTRTLLKAGLKAASGSFAYTPPTTLAGGYYSFVLDPVTPSTLAEVEQLTYIGAPSASGVVTVASSKTSVYVTMTTGFSENAYTFTVAASADGTTTTIGTVSARNGSGAFPLKVPAKLAGKSVTFTITTSKIPSVGCTAVSGSTVGTCASTPVTL